jgi:hypothetical protein
LVVQTITSSVDFVTGSTRFGSILGNTHVFSGSVTMNPGGLFVSSSGVVGIGTTSPNKKLELNTANGVSDGLRITYNSSISEGLDITYLNSGNTTISFDSIYNSNSAVMQFRMKTNGAPLTAMTILGSGNVGIGTSSPGYKLQVNGGNEVGSRFIVTGTYAPIQFSGDNSTTLGGINAYSGIVAIGRGTSTGVNPDIAINSSGNVGIGTNNPQSLFDVTNNNSTAYDSSNALISGQTMRIANNSTTSGISANLLFVAQGAGGGNGLGCISGVNTGTGSLALTFSTRDNGGSVTERMRITSGGNVLIGTTTDGGNILDVLASKDVRFKGATNYITLNLDNSSTTGGGGIYFRNNGTIGGGIGNSGWWLGDTSNDLLLVATASKNIRFHTNDSATERMRITSGGNVGIGVSNPQSRLHIAGTLTFTESGFDTARLNQIVSAHSDGSSANNNLRFLVSDGSGTTAERMRVNGNGNLLIGTTTDNNFGQLQVNSGIGINGSITNIATGTSTFTQAVWYNDTVNQCLFENARTTNDSAGTGRTVYFTWRGGPAYGGGVQLQHGANAWAAYTSDARMKTIVANVENGVDAVMKLNPIKYKWTKELETSRTVLGFTAQNVGDAIPEAVFASWKDDELGDVLSYYQEYITPYLVKAIQEQQLQIEELKAIING